MNDALSLLTGVVVVLAITAVTAYFVAQEFAYMSVDRSKLTARAQAGDDTARRTLAITHRTSFLLSGAQLGITVTGLLVGYVAEPLIGMALSSMLGGVGIPTGIGLTVGGILAITFSTFVQMLFGELYPKNYAIARPEQVSGALARSSALYLKVFGPAIWVFDKSAELLLKRVGIEPVHDVEQAAAADDLHHVVEASKQTGDLAPELSDMLDRIIDFPTENVAHAMIPRAQVDSVRTETNIAEMRALMASGHTRYPVIDGTDDVAGVVHLVDVLAAQDGARPVSSVMRPALIVPELMGLSTALSELDRAKQQLACVIDEFGGFTGIITVEDLAEEVVGEITDEHDPVLPEYASLPDDGQWVMQGSVHIDEVERALDIDLPEGEYETVAGLVVGRLGTLPRVGERVVIDVPQGPRVLAVDEDAPPSRLDIEVLAVERHVPSLLRLTLLEPESAPHDTEEEGSDR